MLQRLLESRALRWAFVAAALAFGVVALVGYGAEVRAAARDLHWQAVVVALVAATASVFVPVMGWRALMAGFGSPLRVTVAIRVVFLSQLGKYLPGSIWPFLAQVELGREHGVPRRRSLTVGLLTVGISLIMGLAVAAATLPLVSPTAARRYGWVLAATPLLLAMLHPYVLNRVLDRILRLTRRPPLESRLSLRTIAVAAAWATAGWLLAGAHIAVLAVDLGARGDSTYVAATGAYALAWSVGFLVVFAPAGLGVREVALTAGLAPVLGTGEAVLVVIASRLLVTVADLLLACVAVLLGRRHVAALPDELAEAASARAAARGSAQESARGSAQQSAQESAQESALEPTD